MTANQYTCRIILFFILLLAGLGKTQAQRLSGQLDKAFNAIDTGQVPMYVNGTNVDIYPTHRNALIVYQHIWDQRVPLPLQIGRIQFRPGENRFGIHTLSSAGYGQSILLLRDYGLNFCHFGGSGHRMYGTPLINDTASIYYPNKDFGWFANEQLLSANYTKIQWGSVVVGKGVKAGMTHCLTPATRHMMWMSSPGLGPVTKVMLTNLQIFGGPYQHKELADTLFQGFYAMGGSSNPAGYNPTEPGILIGKRATGAANAVAYGGVRVFRVQPSPFRLTRIATGIDTNLIGSEVSFFRVLAGGKMLLAGKLRLNGQPEKEAIVRLNADGTIDNTYTPLTVMAASKVSWNIDSLNNVTVGYCNQTGSAQQAVWGQVAANGGPIATPSVAVLPAYYPTCKPQTYIPGRNAFIFSTGKLKTGLVNGQSYIRDTISIGYSFYVDTQGKMQAVDEAKGILYSTNNSVYGDMRQLELKTSLNRRYVLGQGAIAQYNGNFTPRLAVVDARTGNSVTGFNALKFPRSLRERFLIVNHDYDDPYQVHLAGNNRLMVSTRFGHWYNQSIPEPGFPSNRIPGKAIDDTLTIMDSSGAVLSRHNLTGLLQLRNTFLGYRLEGPAPNPTSTDDRRTRYDYKNTLRIIELDSTGSTVGTPIVYNETVHSNCDTLTTAANDWQHIRKRKLIGRDNEGGIWMYVYHLGRNSVNARDTARFLVRFFNGNVQMVSVPDSLNMDELMMVRTLGNNRFRFVGNINTHYHVNGLFRYYQEYEAQAFGTPGPASIVKAWRLPDRFGRRGFQYQLTISTITDNNRVICQLRGYESVIIAYYTDGRYDPTFLPIMVVGTTGYYPSDGPNRFFSGPSMTSAGGRLFLQHGNDTWVRIDILGISFPFSPPPKRNEFAAYTLNQQNTDKAFVSGRVEQVPATSTPLDCRNTAPRRAAPNMILHGYRPAATQPDYIGFADTGGYYTMVLDTGRWSVRQNLENNFLQRQICPTVMAGQPVPGHNVHLPQVADAALQKDFLNQTFNCPRLMLEVVQPRFRLCAREQVVLRYSNDGTAREPNARIRVSLPSLVTILSASRPYFQDPDGTIVFDMGSLEPGQSGQITIVDTVGCPTTPDSTQRACFSARLEPMTVCSAIDASSLGWDGSWLDADARYVPAQDKVRLVVRNRGAQMTDSVTKLVSFYSPIQQPALPRTGPLPAGDSAVFLLDPTLSGTLMVFVNQPINCPVGSTGGLGLGGRSTARSYLNMGPGLLEAQTLQLCPPFRYSYDPNEKVAMPSGDISDKTTITYTLRCENYGNDTAYNVTIVDSLPQQLDVQTFRFVSASHPCNYEVQQLESPQGLKYYQLVFTMTGAGLWPHDSTAATDEGQVTFTIRPKAGTPPGTDILNRASVFFDNNAAVVTPVAKNRISLPRPLATAPNLVGQGRILAWPNPSGNGSITLKAPAQYGQLTLARATGALVGHYTLSSSGQLKLTGLAPGFYIAQVSGLPPTRFIITK